MQVKCKINDLAWPSSPYQASSLRRARSCLPNPSPKGTGPQVARDKKGYAGGGFRVETRLGEQGVPWRSELAISQVSGRNLEQNESTSKLSAEGSSCRDGQVRISGKRP